MIPMRDLPDLLSTLQELDRWSKANPLPPLSWSARWSRSGNGCRAYHEQPINREVTAVEALD